MPVLPPSVAGFKRDASVDGARDATRFVVTHGVRPWTGTKAVIIIVVAQHSGLKSMASSLPTHFHSYSSAIALSTFLFTWLLSTCTFLLPSRNPPFAAGPDDYRRHLEDYLEHDDDHHGKPQYVLCFNACAPGAEMACSCRNSVIQNSPAFPSHVESAKSAPLAYSFVQNSPSGCTARAARYCYGNGRNGRVYGNGSSQGRMPKLSGQFPS
jgi:hypothetical protein